MNTKDTTCFFRLFQICVIIIIIFSVGFFCNKLFFNLKDVSSQDAFAANFVNGDINFYCQVFSDSSIEIDTEQGIWKQITNADGDAFTANNMYKAEYMAGDTVLTKNKGCFLILCHVSFEGPAAPVNWSFGIKKDGVVLGHKPRAKTVALERSENVSIQTTAHLSINDKLIIVMKNLDNDQNPIIKSVSLILIRLSS